MKSLFIAIVVVILAASCTTPGPITGRPDPNSSSSGTLGSVKATDGVQPLRGTGIPPDTSRERKN